MVRSKERELHNSKEGDAVLERREWRVSIGNLLEEGAHLARAFGCGRLAWVIVVVPCV